MMHLKELQLYRIVLQFVCFAKELEFHIKMEYSLTEENIVRCFVKKELPQQGIVIHNEKSYSWRFHGDGITFQCLDFRFHYNKFPVNRIGVTFTATSIIEFMSHFDIAVDFKPEETGLLLQHLCGRKFLEKVWPDNEVYALI
jgi:hypothetical protein